MTRHLRVEYDASKCIAAMECVKRDPAVFGFDSRAHRAILLNGKPSGSIVSREITGDDAHLARTIEATKACPVNAFKVMDTTTHHVLVDNTLHTEKVRELHAHYNDHTDFILDPKGYFLIRVNYATHELEAGFCTGKNNLVLKVIGKKPIDIYHTIATQGHLDLRAEHYAYLGRELEKAYHALMTGLEYVQDDELHTFKARKKESK